MMGKWIALCHRRGLRSVAQKTGPETSMAPLTRTRPAEYRSLRREWLWVGVLVVGVTIWWVGAIYTSFIPLALGLITVAMSGFFREHKKPIDPKDPSYGVRR